ncbi:MAG: protein TolR [Acidiferrobacteraceae bacterium]|nr:protein TolR [Acidiferrobacteraceae bacterium]|tara:strand:+ start:417 stop:842 length:426 start_codon:yes stop_codon:yes gene_type:complete
MVARHRHRRRRQMSEINVVPYIDVMLVLLVIFMVTAPLMMEGIQIDLPDTDAPPIVGDPNNVPFVVSVDQEQQIYLNENEEPIADIAALQASVRAVLRRNPDAAFHLRGEADVEYNFIAHIANKMQQAGASKLSFVTQYQD